MLLLFNCLQLLIINNFILKLTLWMYFATFLKTTAPVKLPISQLSQIILNGQH